MSSRPRPPVSLLLDSMTSEPAEYPRRLAGSSPEGKSPPLRGFPSQSLHASCTLTSSALAPTLLGARPARTHQPPPRGPHRRPEPCTVALPSSSALACPPCWQSD